MNYFLNKVLPEEKDAIPYLPTTAEYLKFLEDRYPTQLALSDEQRSVTFQEIVDHISHRRSPVMAAPP